MTIRIIAKSAYVFHGAGLLGKDLYVNALEMTEVPDALANDPTFQMGVAGKEIQVMGDKAQTKKAEKALENIGDGTDSQKSQALTSPYKAFKQADYNAELEKRGIPFAKNMSNADKMSLLASNDEVVAKAKAQGNAPAQV